MRLIRIVVSLYITLLVVVLMELSVGRAGLLAYRSVASYHEVLLDNLSELKEINSRLNREFEQLATNPEKIRLEARELGYFEDGEKIVKLEGRSREKRFFEVGRIIRWSGAHRDNRTLIRIILGLLPPVLYVLSGVVPKRTAVGNGHRARL